MEIYSTWMSRWKLGSMVSKWVISPQYTNHDEHLKEPILLGRKFLGCYFHGMTSSLGEASFCCRIIFLAYIATKTTTEARLSFCHKNYHLVTKNLYVLTYARNEKKITTRLGMPKRFHGRWCSYETSAHFCGAQADFGGRLSQVVGN